MKSFFNVTPSKFLCPTEIGYLPKQAGGKLLRRKFDVIFKQPYLHAYGFPPWRMAGHGAVAQVVNLCVNGAVHVNHRAANLPTAYQSNPSTHPRSCIRMIYVIIIQRKNYTPSCQIKPVFLFSFCRPVIASCFSVLGANLHGQCAESRQKADFYSIFFSSMKHDTLQNVVPPLSVCFLPCVCTWPKRLYRRLRKP